MPSVRRRAVVGALLGVGVAFAIAQSLSQHLRADAVGVELGRALFTRQ